MNNNERNSPGDTPKQKNLVDLFSDMESEDIMAKKPPTVKFLEWLHRNVSTSRDADHHHKIGTDEGDVARGQHDHDGKNSPGLWAGTDVPTDPTEDIASLAAWAAEINALLRTKSKS